MSELKFVPFSSSVHPGFWSAFTKLKLEVLGLEDKPVDLQGHYENKDAPGLSSLMTVEWDAFESSTKDLNWCSYSSIGSLVNHNTMEAFKNFDKVGFLENLKDSLVSDQVLEDPRLLSRFVIHMFADLKKYHYYYWFAFPALVPESSFVISENMKNLDEAFAKDVIEEIMKEYGSWKKSNPIHSGFFWIKLDPGVKILSLKEGLNEEGAILAFADPSSLQDHPGWPLRNLLAFILSKRPNLLQKGLKVLCLRQKVINSQLSISSSKILTIQSNPSKNDAKVTGWEKNEKNQFAPKFANMRSSMDPKSLAESSVDLNLKLMKWRLVPSLNLDKMYNLKVLLLGSGTLGCNVARCLLGWGVKNMTFVDNSKVSYSNPVRQSLFQFEDCLDGGRSKAKAASDMMEKIFPGVKSQGYDLNISMPGHPISSSLVEKVRKDFGLLEDLIQNHDVIFLLMDTRESRWLPSVMSAHFGKIVINAALGFDSFLVMRHGKRDSESWKSFEGLNGVVPGNQLGCYFCNDIVAPGDSTRDRTLDQQCTVTRPGVSYQAAAFAVEVMASIVQHPKGQMASAIIKPESHQEEEEGPLGPVVHSIRGNVHSFQTTKPTTQRFSNCTACSQKVLEEYAKDGFELLMKTANDPKYLENLTGLSSLMSETTFDDIIVCSDDEDEF